MWVLNESGILEIQTSATTVRRRVLVKSVQHEARGSVKEEVQAQWAVRERQLLDSIQAFFVEQLVL